MLRKYQVTATASGGAGSSTGDATSNETVIGRLLAVHLDFSVSGAATTDTIITTITPDHTILTITDSATDAWYYPRHQVHTEAGAGVTYDGSNEVYDAIPVHGRVKVAMAQANNAQTVTATFYVEE